MARIQVSKEWNGRYLRVGQRYYLFKGYRNDGSANLIVLHTAPRDCKVLAVSGPRTATEEYVPYYLSLMQQIYIVVGIASVVVIPMLLPGSVGAVHTALTAAVIAWCAFHFWWIGYYDRDPNRGDKIIVVVLALSAALKARQIAEERNTYENELAQDRWDQAEQQRQMDQIQFREMQTMRYDTNPSDEWVRGWPERMYR